MSDERPWRDEETLQKLYIEKGMTMKKIAEDLGCSQASVSRGIKKTGIGAEHECPTCGEKFTSKEGVSAHHKHMHGESLAERKRRSESEHECPTCGDLYRSEHGVKVHHKRVHGESLGGFKKTCPQCDSEFIAKWTGSVYCSQECSLANLHDSMTGEGNPNWKPSVTLECEWCGSQYERQPSEVDKSRFCDASCRSAWVASEYNDYERITLECNGCGNEFEVAQHRADTAKYCSRECLRSRITLECENCGDLFEVQEYRKEFARACSRECAHDLIGLDLRGKSNPRWIPRVTLTCEQCGDSYDVPHWRESASRFCSNSCHTSWQSENRSGPNHHQWEGGQFPYGAGWNDAKKEAVRERDKRTCQHCGRPEKEHVEMFGRKHSVHHIVPARQFDDPERRNAMDNLITLCQGGCHQIWERMSPLRPDITLSG